MDEAFLHRSKLCRRIQVLGFKDTKHRAAPVLCRWLADRGKPMIVRLEAARTLARWGHLPAKPVADKIVASRWEDPVLRERLVELSARSS